jgi:hypothetical protein
VQLTTLSAMTAEDVFHHRVHEGRFEQPPWHLIESDSREFIYS